MWLLAWLSLLLPTVASDWHGLERPAFVFGPHGKAELRPLRVCSLDQLFFGSASGSTTLTTSPFLRLRFDMPVSHQLLVRGQIQPAS